MVNLWLSRLWGRGPRSTFSFPVLWICRCPCPGCRFCEGSVRHRAIGGDDCGDMAMLIELTRLLPWARRSSASVAEPLSVVAVHDEYVDIVWRWLQRLGVREPDLEDLLQEVFEVVHHQLSTFDTSRPFRPWLFGICNNVVRRHRRRAYVRLETTELETPEVSSEGVMPDPEEIAAARQESEELNALLRELDPAKRVVFIMFELDDLSCQEIAEELGIPEGTVHSRLHAARKAFQNAVSRRRARAARQGGT